jgi:ankyrin repeat protein
MPQLAKGSKLINILKNEHFNEIQFHVTLVQEQDETLDVAEFKDLLKLAIDKDNKRAVGQLMSYSERYSGENYVQEVEQALQKKHLECALYMLRSEGFQVNVDINARNLEGKTLLDIAIQHEAEGIFKLLVREGARFPEEGLPTMSDSLSEYYTAVKDYVENPTKDSIAKAEAGGYQAYLDAKDNNRNTALHFAVFAGDAAVVKELLAKMDSCTIKAKNVQGRRAQNFIPMGEDFAGILQAFRDECGDDYLGDVFISGFGTEFWELYSVPVPEHAVEKNMSLQKLLTMLQSLQAMLDSMDDANLKGFSGIERMRNSYELYYAALYARLESDFPEIAAAEKVKLQTTLEREGVAKSLRDLTSLERKEKMVRKYTQDPACHTGRWDVEAGHCYGETMELARILQGHVLPGSKKLSNQEALRKFTRKENKDSAGAILRRLRYQKVQSNPQSQGIKLGEEKLWDQSGETTVEDNSLYCLLFGSETVGVPGHALLIGYRDDKWILWDPNIKDSFVSACDTKAELKSAIQVHQKRYPHLPKITLQNIESVAKSRPALADRLFTIPGLQRGAATSPPEGVWGDICGKIDAVYRLHKDYGGGSSELMRARRALIREINDLGWPSLGMRDYDQLSKKFTDFENYLEFSRATLKQFEQAGAKGSLSDYEYKEFLSLQLFYPDLEDKISNGAARLRAACRAGDGGQVEVLAAADNVDARDASGMTALMHAVEHGHETVVVALLEAGADISVQDGDGKTALELASSSHNSGIQALLNLHRFDQSAAARPVGGQSKK